MARRPLMLAVVSDLPLVAFGLRSLLQPHAERIEVVEWGAGECDVVLFDPTGRPDADERRLAELVADPRAHHVAVYSVGWSARSMREAQRIGVDAFLPKTLTADQLADALGDVVAGRPIGTSSRAGRARRAAATWLGRDDGLTERESQVLGLCADGLSNQEIADALYINVETVKSHLKHAYSRLGLRNRAQAVSYVHRLAPPALTPVEWQPPAEPATRTTDVDADADAANVPPEELASRLALLALDGDRRAALGALVPDVDAGADAFVARLLGRWEQHPATRSLLTDHVVAERLVVHQRRYLSELFGGAFDARHAAAMLRIGTIHHRLRVPPQWYLASSAHLICDHLPLVLGDADARGVDALVVLVSSVLFDATLVLDAYELAVSDEILRQPAAPEPAPQAEAPAGAARSPRRQPTITEFPSLGDEATDRTQFLEIGEAELTVLRATAGRVATAMPDVLARFYDLIEAHPELRHHVGGAVTERLRREVATYWAEVTDARFDRAHAASRQRVGVIHERIGLTPQYYLAGLAVQLSGVLRAVIATSDDAVRDADVIIRAAFYDMTFVIDAYLDARVSSLLQTGQYASQVVAGLADGVAVVDARDRIEFANEPFLDLVGVDPSVLRRMPVDAALPVAGIRELVDAARSGGTGRVTTVHRVRGRTLRVIALRLASSSGRGPMVAVVVDDISEVLRAGEQIAREDRRLEHVLDAVDALAWEADAGTMLLCAVSRAAHQLTGVRDVDLLGRARFVDLIHTDDVRGFLVRCSSLRPGDRADVEHRIVRPDGTVRRARSSVVATTGRAGEPTISGVTLEIPDAPAADGRSGDAVSEDDRGSRARRR